MKMAHGTCTLAAIPATVARNLVKISLLIQPYRLRGRGVEDNKGTHIQERYNVVRYAFFGCSAPLFSWEPFVTHSLGIPSKCLKNHPHVLKLCCLPSFNGLSCFVCFSSFTCLPSVIVLSFIILPLVICLWWRSHILVRLTRRLRGFRLRTGWLRGHFFLPHHGHFPRHPSRSRGGSTRRAGAPSG